MHAGQTPFRPGWWSISLRRYRPCDDTYCLFPYDSLPPIDSTGFRGDFHWLPPLDPALRDVGAVDEKRAEIARHLPALIAEAGTRGVTLPAAFLAFMRDPEAHRRVPTCTACYFDLPAELTPSPFGDDAYLIRFLNDQQWLLLWHLYLKPDGDHCVVVSSTAYDEPLDWSADDEDGGMAGETAARLEELRAETWWCAPDFEVFLYRFWLENHLWFSLTRGRPLTEDEDAYLRHYREWSSRQDQRPT